MSDIRFRTTEKGYLDYPLSFYMTFSFVPDTDFMPGVTCICGHCLTFRYYAAAYSADAFSVGYYKDTAYTPDIQKVCFKYGDSIVRQFDNTFTLHFVCSSMLDFTDYIVDDQNNLTIDSHVVNDSFGVSQLPTYNIYYGNELLASNVPLISSFSSSVVLSAPNGVNNYNASFSIESDLFSFPVVDNCYFERTIDSSSGFPAGTTRYSFSSNGHTISSSVDQSTSEVTAGTVYLINPNYLLNVNLATDSYSYRNVVLGAQTSDRFIDNQGNSWSGVSSDIYSVSAGDFFNFAHPPVYSPTPGMYYSGSLNITSIPDNWSISSFIGSGVFSGFFGWSLTNNTAFPPHIPDTFSIACTSHSSPYNKVFMCLPDDITTYQYYHVNNLSLDTWSYSTGDEISNDAIFVDSDDSFISLSFVNDEVPLSRWVCHSIVESFIDSDGVEVSRLYEAPLVFRDSHNVSTVIYPSSVVDGCVYYDLTSVALEGGIQTDSDDIASNRSFLNGVTDSVYVRISLVNGHSYTLSPLFFKCFSSYMVADKLPDSDTHYHLIVDGKVSKTYDFSVNTLSSFNNHSALSSDVYNQFELDFIEPTEVSAGIYNYSDMFNSDLVPLLWLNDDVVRPLFNELHVNIVNKFVTFYAYYPYSTHLLVSGKLFDSVRPFSDYRVSKFAGYQIVPFPNSFPDLSVSYNPSQLRAAAVRNPIVCSCCGVRVDRSVNNYNSTFSNSPALLVSGDLSTGNFKVLRECLVKDSDEFVDLSADDD